MPSPIDTPAGAAPAAAPALSSPAPCTALPGPPPGAVQALGRGRAALLVRYNQLAACRVCGAEAAAYHEAAATLEALADWLSQLATHADPL